MPRSFLLTASFILCWAISPDVLVLLGNGFGRHGWAFGIALLAGAALSAAAALIIRRPTAASRENDRGLPDTEAGRFAEVTLTLAGRLSPPLFFSTGMLVTAGFTFNETFVYWFPNFGFSFLLLLLVLILYLSGERVVLAAQQVFFGLTASCLLLLALAGLLAGPPQNTGPAAPAGTAKDILATVPLAMLFFLGYDQQLPKDKVGKNRFYPGAVGLGFLLLVLWGLASLSHIPHARLAESSVPYVVAAREILGQTGRILMGIAIISGTCGAVNGLFYLAIGTVRQLIPKIAPSTWLPRIHAVLMAAVIALLLALGLAGSENLEVFVFGSLLLWQLAIGANCLFSAVHLRRQRAKHSSSGYAIGGLILAAVAYLAFTYPQPRLLFGFCVPVLAAGGLFSTALHRLGGRRSPASNNIHPHKGG